MSKTTATLFEAGYTVEPSALSPTALLVFNPDCSERYTVDVQAMTCTCKAFTFGRGVLCKHICGAALLVRNQIADYYRQQRRFAELDKAASTYRQREAAKQAGEACIRLATELENFEQDMGLVVVQPERVAA